MTNILRIDSGADHAGSVTRQLADALVEHLVAPGDQVVRRAATDGVPVVNGSWVEAAFADGDPAALALSDELVDELLAADELVLVAPVYNLGIPAALKAWVDQVLRVGRTFGFGADGPVGLVGARRAWIVTASGSTRVGSEQDFNTPYLRAVLGLIGIEDVRVVAADGHLADQDALDRALATFAAVEAHDLVA